MYLLYLARGPPRRTRLIDGASYLARFMALRSAQRATAGTSDCFVVIDAAPARFDLLRGAFAPAASRRSSSANRKAVAEGSAIIITC
jgi:hypothetical protein